MRRNNYYSVNIERAKDISPRNKDGYHKEILEYWLGFIKEFDATLDNVKPVVRLAEVGPEPEMKVIGGGESCNAF